MMMNDEIINHHHKKSLHNVGFFYDKFLPNFTK